MQRESEIRKVVTDEQRESHEWRLLIRKLRAIGLAESAARLETALAASPLQSEPDIHPRI